MMRPLAIASSGRRAPRARIGDVPILSSLVTDVEASARAALYQRLADFQALPQRLNRVMAELSAYAAATPARGLDESAQLSVLQSAAAETQSQWSATNATVTRAMGEIGSVVSGGNVASIASDVAQAIAGMTVASSSVGNLEQQAQSFVQSAASLSDADRARILAIGAGQAITLMTFVKWGAIGYVAYRVIKALS